QILGGIDPRSETSVIEQGTKLELPYWIAKVFLEDGVALFEYPKIFTEMYRDVLKADASVVDLFKMSKYFYEFGRQLTFLRHRDSEELSNTLIQTFIDRFRKISDWAQATSLEAGTADKLENLERSIMARGQKAQSKLSYWLAHGVGTITTAEMVGVHNKRKKLEEEFNIHKN
ncbi:hypothetical protein AAG570_002993, partial [Ranatra chinensis]